METLGDDFVQWTLTEQSNNDRGVLVFSVSRNHRTSGVWAMLDWIAVHGPGSYGLFYVHDDELAGVDGNRYRVHRLLHGVITDMDDPFFPDVVPALEG